MPKVRPISTLNKLFLYLSTLVNGNSCEVIELGGKVDHELLQEAIRTAMRRHPVLNSRLKRRLFNYVWEEADTEMPIDFRVHRLPSDEPESLHRHLIDNVWDEPLNLYAGRPGRFHLTELPGRSFLQLVTTHVWSDARAGYRLASDIAADYTSLAEGRQPKPARIDITDRRSSRLLTGEFPKPRPFYWLKAIGLILKDIVSQDRGLVLSRKRGSTNVQRYDLGPEFLAQLRQAARTAGVTVHAFLTVALLRACQAYNAKAGHRMDGVYRFLDLFSLRSFAQENVSDLYDTMVVPFRVRMDSSRSDAELIGNVANQLQRLKKGDIMAELFRQRLYAMSATFLPKRSATNLVTRFVAQGNIVCSNPGPVSYPIEAFGPVPVVDFYSFSQLFPPGRVMCIFSTFRDNLRLIAVYDGNAFQEDALASYLIQPLITKLQHLMSTPDTGTTSLVQTGQPGLNQA